MDASSTPNALPAIASLWLRRSRATHAYRLDDAGTVLEANDAALAALRLGAAAVVGRPLSELLASGSVPPPAQAGAAPVSVTFAVEGSGARYSLECLLLVESGERWLIGEQPAVDAEVETELRRTNNELAVLARDYAQQATALREAIGERDRAEWTLKKVGEVLPICMTCGNLRDDAGGWASASTFLMESGIPLSHGLCPPCGQAALASIHRGPE